MHTQYHNQYPKVSILHYRNSEGKWEFKIVLEGKEEEKSTDLMLVGCTEVYVAFDKCKYLGKT